MLIPHCNRIFFFIQTTAPHLKFLLVLQGLKMRILYISPVEGWVTFFTGTPRFKN